MKALLSAVWVLAFVAVGRGVPAPAAARIAPGSAQPGCTSPDIPPVFPEPVSPAPRGILNACGTETTNSGRFTDVAPTSPYHAAVTCLRRWGITQGTSASTYSPTQPVSREQMAGFIARLVTTSGATLPEPRGDYFLDDGSSRFQSQINSLAEANIVHGVATGHYAPKEQVTRAQMAAFLDRAYGYIAVQAGEWALSSGEEYFTDDDSSALNAAVNIIAAAGIAGGHADGTYRPENPVRRDHMALFLTRTLDLLIDEAITSPLTS